MVDLSVIIVNWNTAELLGRCLTALGPELEGLTSEVVVIDNGSSDGSSQWVRERCPQARLIENDANRGFAFAANQGMKVATGRYLLLLNTDAMVHSGAVRAMMAVMDADLSIGLLGARLLNEDGSWQNSVANTPSLLTEVGKKSLLKRVMPGRFYSRSFAPPGPVDVESLVGACVMARAEMVAKVGGLDEEFFFFFEETDWCVRARAAGWRIMFHPDALVAHLQGRSAAQTGVRARIEYWRSRYLFFRKHHGLGVRATLAIALQIELWIDILYFALLTPFSSKKRRRLAWCVKILFWHVAGCPAAWGLPRGCGAGVEVAERAPVKIPAILNRS